MYQRTDTLEIEDTTKAYLIPIREEIIQTIAYAPGESLQSFSQRTGLPFERIIKLNANESPYGLVPAALRALHSHQWYNYYPDTCASSLKDAIARYAKISPDHIVLGHGSMEVIQILWHLFLSPGDSLVCCPPTFSLYEMATSLCGAKIRHVQRTNNYEIDPDAIQAALTPEVKFIVLCSPNNPTGNSITEKVLLTLLKTGRIVIVDEAYVEFSSHPEGYASLVSNYDNLIILRTLSKWAGLAGLRVGYGLFPRWIVPYMQRAQQPFEVNVAGSLAATATLTHLNEAQERVQRILAEREHLFQLLAEQPYLSPFPSEGNFVFARISDTQMQLERVQHMMEQEGIMLRYFPRLDEVHDYIRVTVGLPEHTRRLTITFAQLLKATNI